MHRLVYPIRFLILALAVAGPAAAQAPPASPAPSSEGETAIPVILGDPAEKPPAPVPQAERPLRRVPAPPQEGLGFWETLGLTLVLVGLLAGARALYARRRRRCDVCGKKMVRGTREETFAALQPDEKVHSMTGEIVYTLWRCPACGDEHVDADVQNMPTTAGVRPTMSPLGLEGPAPRERRGPSLLRLPKDPEPDPAEEEKRTE
jgi:hypothetical protein